MRKTILLLGSVMLFTGCATQAPLADRGNSVRESCIKAGFTPGTDKFGNCFLTLMTLENENKNKGNFVQQYMLNRALNPDRSEINYGPETTTCSGTGSTRTCRTTGGTNLFPKTITCTGTGDIRTCTSN